MIDILENVVTSLLRMFLILGVCIGLLLWGTWAFIDWMWIDEVVKAHHVIIPSLEVTVKNGVADTLYIYKLP